MENSPNTMAVTFRDFEDSLQYTVTSCTKSTVHVKCLWTISKFKELRDKMKRKDFIHSSEILTFFSQKFSFCFTLHPKGDTLTSESGISITTSRSPTFKVWVLLQFAVKDRDGNLHFYRKYKSRPCFMDVSNVGWKFIPCDFPSPGTEETFLPNGSLQIFSEMTFWTEHRDLQDDQFPADVKTKMVSSSISLELLLHSGYASDVNLYVEYGIPVTQTCYNAHKGILASKSTTFKEMFDKPPYSRTQLMPIGVRPDVFKQVLHFMYTDTATASLKSMLEDILPFAIRFGIGILKDFCIAEMIQSISIGNVLNYYRVSDEVKVKELNKKCVEFIIKNRESIEKLPEWKVFNEIHKALAESLEGMINSLEKTMISENPIADSLEGMINSLEKTMISENPI